MLYCENLDPADLPAAASRYPDCLRYVLDFECNTRSQPPMTAHCDYNWGLKLMN
jgi:hypothetical protein